MKKEKIQVLALLIACFLLLTAPLFAVDVSISPSGFAIIPFGEGSTTIDGTQRYDIGGGGSLAFEVDISSFISNPIGLGYTAGIEGGMLFSPQMYGGGQMVFYSLGANIGLYYFPLSRLPLRIDGAVGVFTANDGTAQVPSNLWFRAGGETGFRFTPAFTLTANAGWRQFMGENRPLNSGVYAGLGLRFTFELGERAAGGVAVTLDQYDAVFPALAAMYQQFPIGSVTVRNNENAEIRNVRLFFRAGDFTSSEFPSGEANIIPKGRSVDFPLYADFSPELLRFADSGRILGEVVIRYTFLGREREAVRTVNIAVNSRNTPAPGGNSALAAFVSAANPEVLQFARYAAALARTNHRMGLNSNMETGIWLFEAVRENITVRETPRLNYVQFPSQTLAYRSGSLLDIALLYAAGLQSAGISGAIILLPDGEILAAISPGLRAGDAATAALFNGTDRLLITGGEVWLPVSMSRLGEGFTAAWQEAVRLLNEAEEAEMIIIEEAWVFYQPAPFPSLGVRLALPDSAAVNAASNRAVLSYINNDFIPRIAALQAQTRQNPTAALFNQLGNLHLRAGQMAQARAAYEQAANRGSVGAMVNRGNMALNDNDLQAAERWFRQALAVNPLHASAQRGMEFVEARR